jgi:hypothetical protein
VSEHGYPASTDAVSDAFANQVRYCRENDAPITARVVAALAEAVASGASNPFLDRVCEWQGAPLADGLPLRCAGALHALHLSEREPALAAIYAGGKAEDRAIVAQVIARHSDELLPWLDGPPQTNEAGRSASFIAAMLWLAEQGLPARFDCLEIGSSAGINLMLDRFAYDLGGVHVTPKRPVLSFAPEWRGPPPPARPIAFAAVRGCDIAPLDLADPVQSLRLKAYIWPEHRVRFERLEAAIAAARDRPPDLVQMDAAEFVEAELARPQAEGTTRLLMHSIVWQYVPADQQARVTAAMERAGRLATPTRAVAWVALEANRTLARHELVVRYWPGGEQPVILGRAHAHGAWIEWFEEPIPAE